MSKDRFHVFIFTLIYVTEVSRVTRQNTSAADERVWETCRDPLSCPDWWIFLGPSHTQLSMCFWREILEVKGDEGVTGVTHSYRN